MFTSQARAVMSHVKTALQLVFPCISLIWKPQSVYFWTHKTWMYLLCTLMLNVLFWMSLLSVEPQVEETNKVMDASTSQPLEVKMMSYLRSGLTGHCWSLVPCCYLNSYINSCYQFELEVEDKVCVDSVCLSAPYLAGVCGAVGPIQRIHGEIQ